MISISDLNNDSFFNPENYKKFLEEEKADKKQKRYIATWDIETDPFLYGREPRPFACGFYCPDLEIYKHFWGDDCISQFLEFIETCGHSFHIYAHNGGTFDFIYLLRMGCFNDLKTPPNIINGRIVKSYYNSHIFQDSYALLPIPLASLGDKLDIDYDKMEADKRDFHKEEILTYLKADCVELYKVVKAFRDDFGNRLTIGQTAVKELMKEHPFDRVEDEELDKQFRDYYFGGRVQCFKKGKLEGDYHVYDVNSMYPAVMAQKLHPISFGAFTISDGFNRYFDSKRGNLIGAFKGKPYFIKFSGVNRQALPVRDKNNSLDFTVERGTFWTMSHELEIALKYNLVEIETIHELIICPNTINFKGYVKKFKGIKEEGKRTGNKFQELFGKLLLNSAYGKTAQNWKNYKESAFFPKYEAETCQARIDNRIAIETWETETGLKFDINKYREYENPPLLWIPKPDDNFDGNIRLWERPLAEGKFYDVAIGASITSAARAMLLEAIVNATDPIYCDTDSIICKKLEGVRFDPVEFGAWDHEASGDCVYIYAKKVYAVYSGGKPFVDKKGKEKIASKGVKSDAAGIKALVEGQTLMYGNDAPSFKLGKKTEFVQRVLGAEKHSKIYDKFGQKIDPEKIDKKVKKKLDFENDLL